MMKTLGPLILIVLWTSMAVPRVSAALHPAAGVVENLHTGLLAVMRDGEKLGFKGRYDRLAPVITTSFDLPFIAKTVMGRYWQTLSADQKPRFIEVFSRLSIATYATNFDAYSGERFKAISEREPGSGQREVKSRLVKSDGGEVSLDYILHRVGNEWRIINVIAEGVSDLALKRTDYTGYLKKHGFDALLGRLNEKITQYSR